MAGGLAYVADDFAGLRILDVGAPASVVEIGLYDDSFGGGTGIATDGHTAFLTANLEGMLALDVDSLPGVSHLSSTSGPSRSLSVTLEGNLAFLSDFTYGLRVFDVTTPSAPIELGTYTGSSPVHCAIHGSYAYLAVGGAGLDIVNISNPAAPFREGLLNTPGSARWVAFEWPFAFVADYGQGLRVIDVSDPTSPLEVGNAPIGGPATGVALMDGYALVAAGGADVQIFDVNNPSAPTMVGSWTLHNYSQRIHVSGSMAAVADVYGVSLLDVSDPSSPVQAGTYLGLPDQTYEAVFQEDRLFVAGLYGLKVEDLSTCCTSGPGSFSLVSPADGATDAETSSLFNWTDASWALRYDLYLDTVNPPVMAVSEGLRLSSALRDLLPGTTYYWKVVAHNPCGTLESEVRSFTTALPDLSLHVSDDPEPVLTTRPVTYAVTLTNETAGGASAVNLDTTLATTGSAVLTFDAGASDPRWTEGTPGELHASLGSFAGSASTTLTAVFQTSGVGTATLSAAISLAEADPDPADNAASQVTAVEPIALGNQVWRDDDGDGVRDLGEPGLSGVVVKLYDGSYQWLQEVLTDPAGGYRFNGLAYGGTYLVKFFLPSGDYVFSPKDRGGDDGYDSDADTTTGQTGWITLTDGADPTRWDCGMVYGSLCVAPDEPVYIYSVTLTTDGNEYPILNFMDSNQANQVTGYNVYRTHDPDLPPASWSQVASDVTDMDEATPNKQWIDTSGDDPPPGYTVWYYQVAAYNHLCPAEGPW